MKNLILVFTAMSLITSASAQEKGTIKDERDGKTYKTVTIGKQTWMAENLNYTTKSGSWCYDDKEEFCNKFGKLYNWETAKEACPVNWHLPSDAEWTQLVDFLGGEDVAAGKMKVTDKNVWLAPNTGATNSSGFSTLPGGFRNHEGSYGDTEMENGSYGNWWSSTEEEGGALRRRNAYKFAGVGRAGGDKRNGYSVRCVKN